MAEFNLERFKYVWRGDWVASTNYNRDDIIRFSGKTYVCVKGHVAQATFAEDLNNILEGSNPPQPDPRWIVMTASRSFRGNWAADTQYIIDDLVQYQGSLHLCIKDHTSTDQFGDNADAWGLQALGLGYENDWQSQTDYSPGTTVRYNGKVYRCAVGHTSGNLLEDDVSETKSKNKWDVFFEGVEWRGDWDSGEEYRHSDLVSYGASIFRCTETHTSGGNALDITKFVLEFPGYQADGDYDPATYYNQGDIVRYGGYLYYAIANNHDSDPSNTDADSSNNWILLAQTTKFVGEWSISGRYRTGEIVHRGGYLYECIEDVSLGEGDGSTQDFIPDYGDSSSTKWRVIVPGNVYKGLWNSNTFYSVGHIIHYLGETWRCKVEHEPDSRTYPENGNGFDYWEIFNTIGRKGGLKDRGDLLTYNVGLDGSTIEDTNIPIGNDSQILRTVQEQDIYWDNLKSAAEVLYVDWKNGKDDIGRGGQYNPLKTVRYACNVAEDNFPPETLKKIQVATGYYQEVGPITVPANCAVMGDELRATTIAASPALASYGGLDWTYTQAWLDHFITYVSPLITFGTINKSLGNPENPVVSGQPSDNASATAIADLIQVFKNKVEFLAFDGESDVAISGTNTLSSNTARKEAARILRLNKKFIEQESLAYLKIAYPTLTWNEDKLRSDIHDMVRSLARDTEYPGEYLTVLSAERYVAFKNGSQTKDLFWLRDATGVRRCTIDGLEGTLNPPGVFDLYQRPTGGACVALDPGWGPADDRTWIKTRSPYIQGVTNIGTRCVGCKIDGELHNGGNKSMVTNDFTQVLSDGIGVWVTNNARAELVSMFTYYCQVGYLAENGGVIRAVVGNNSYGSFGAIADGNDPTETPIPVTINNQENEAQVISAIAGTSNDELFIFEYGHCGQKYTSASSVIKGAGEDAEVEFSDFRTNALFQARLINTKGSGSEGGSNYINREANAQLTADATSTLRLTGNDLTNLDTELIGSRIIIIAGQGIGQYGYITAWNPVTKDVSVARESDGQAGWDHIIPGTPLEPSFDSTCRYRIEPRLAVQDPGFSSQNFTFVTNRFHKDVAYGYTTATYNDISVATGTGEVFEDLEKVPARFNVVRTGPTYTVTFQGAARGAGYAVGDVLTITGDLVGGAAPDNNITITVTEVTEDSTASIISFTYEGTPRGKRFVAVGTPNFSYYSDAGTDTWDETTLPNIGGWPKIRAGANAFVALQGDSSNTVAFSYDGESWTTRALPETANWKDLAYGGGYFVAIAGDTNTIAYSDDGLTWNSATLPDAVGDSSIAQWARIEYGAGRFVAIANSDRIVAYADSSNITSWTSTANALPVNSNSNDGQWDFEAIAYGDNRFLAITDAGYTCYSLDRGITWYEGIQAPVEPGAGTYYRDLKYGDGIFMALSNNGDRDNPQASSNCFTTEYGTAWRTRTMNGTQIWTAFDYANINGTGYWVQMAQEATTQGIEHIRTGRQAKLRADIFQGVFQNMKIWDPGSGYDVETNPPQITVTDPQFITQVETDNRVDSGVIAQPDFINRGAGYRTSTSTITITGDGYADIVPEENVIVLNGATVIPGPGFQIRINGILDLNTEDPDDLKLFTGVEVEDLGDDGSGNGTSKIKVTITPSMKNEYNLAHGTAATLRLRYSQCRISNHDFLDIGTGNFEETNYPEIYAGGRYFQAAPENEILEENGGRVFYVSSDQDGNFRTGELFSVQQSTGIVTISAEFFDLDGLSELSLGGVRLGGSGAVIREFSTDPTFAEDSNNVVPTQRAIATFLADRLSVGGSDLETNDIQAGKVKVGSDANRIETSTGEYLQIPVDVDFSGQDLNGNPTYIQGTIVGQMLMFRDENQTTQ